MTEMMLCFTMNKNGCEGKSYLCLGYAKKYPAGVAGYFLFEQVVFLKCVPGTDATKVGGKAIVPATTKIN